MNRLLNIIKNGYASFWNTEIELETENAIRIYSDQSQVDFLIRWDLYYLNLTIDQLKLNNFLILILWLREYFLNLFKNIFFYKKTYFIDGPINYNINYMILFSDREDLDKLFKKYEIIFKAKTIKLSSKKTIHISFKSIFNSLLCFSFQDIFKSRLKSINFKIDTTNLNSILYLYEGRSLEYRALYKFLKQNGCKINFFWTKSATNHYSINELSTSGNLDYPEKLYRPEHKIGNIINTINELSFTESILIVLPTFSNYNQILIWISAIRQFCKAPSYAYSLHPTAHKNLLFDLLDNEFIDIDKSNYMNKYNNFIGFDSNLLLMALDNSKEVYPVAINDTQIKFLKDYSDLKKIYYLKKV
jgi:hypothetical protein